MLQMGSENIMTHGCDNTICGNYIENPYEKARGNYGLKVLYYGRGNYWIAVPKDKDVIRFHKAVTPFRVITKGAGQQAAE